MAKTVLIVDDNHRLREILACALQREGFKTLEAGTGLEAIQTAVVNTPDVIMLDLELPDMEGTNVARFLKSQARRRQTLQSLAGLAIWASGLGNPLWLPV